MFRYCIFLLTILLFSFKGSQAYCTLLDDNRIESISLSTKTFLSSDCSLSSLHSYFEVPEDASQEEILKSYLFFDIDLSLKKFNEYFFEEGISSFYLFYPNNISVALFLLFEQIKIPL